MNLGSTPQNQANKEMQAVGLQWVETKGFLPSQHVMVFKKYGIKSS